MKKLFWVILLITLGGGLFAFNYFSVGKPLAEVLKSESRNTGININAHYKWYCQPSILVIDIDKVSGDKSAADVFRVILQYASKVKDKTFESIFLTSKGKIKFILEGDYFSQLGNEYGQQNPVYTMRTFTEHLHNPDGTKAFSTWTGGLLGVLKEQMEDFGEFHKKWYVEDM